MADQTQNELIKKVADRLDLPEDQVKLVVDNFWSGIKSYINNPHETKEGILINEYFKFKLRIRSVYRMVYKTPDKAQERTGYPIQYWKDILDNIKKLGNK